MCELSKNCVSVNLHFLVRRYDVNSQTGYSRTNTIPECTEIFYVINNNFTRFFYVFLTMYPRIISQINPTKCKILFNIFIYFSSLHVSGIHVPIIRRKLLYLCDTGICHSCLVGLNSIQPADQTPPIQSDKYQCRIDTAVFSL